ncbi:hypothetical protein SAMN03159488_04129 [Pseudomonas sp. NFIX10]|nr:hypothetical protein SAMN03159488_04129 [Pseudomonas sp. NFIX10]SFF20664.1 hypothetical protein SAMN03159367_03491 [Pseudomonas sp. NFACC06-1]
MIEHAFDVDEIEQATRLEAHIKSLKNLPDSPARNTVVADRATALAAADPLIPVA